MVALTKRDLEYINNYFQREGDIEIKTIDTSERLCVISVPVFDGQEDTADAHKIITIPVSYGYDGEDVYVYDAPTILSNEDISIISDAVTEVYEQHIA